MHTHTLPLAKAEYGIKLHAGPIAGEGAIHIALKPWWRAAQILLARIDRVGCAKLSRKVQLVVEYVNPDYHTGSRASFGTGIKSG